MGENAEKILIVYFSHTGQNYVNGSVAELKKGNTAAVAQMISALTGAPLFEVKPKQAYPFVYRACTDAAQKELQADARPALAETTDTSGYDTIILGYPNWWGTMPMAMFTFLEGSDLAGKTLLPFCTHEGSGMGRSESDLKRLCPAADVRGGLAIRGSAAAQSKPAVEQWLKKNLRRGQR